MLDATHRVRDLAYRIWETEGCPAGREKEHWLEAERRVLAESHAVAPAKPKSAKPAAKAPAKRASKDAAAAPRAARAKKAG